jgi:hypothetical protein
VVWDFGTFPPHTQGPTNYVTVRANTNAIGGAVIVNLATAMSSNLPPVTARDRNPRCPTCPPGVVVSPNSPPVNCVAQIVPAECVLTFPGLAETFVLSLNNADACVILAGSASDPDGNPLQYIWSTNGVVIGAGPLITNCLPAGCHTVTLTVSDGVAVCQTDLNVCVVGACQAVEQCIALVQNSNIARANKRPFLATLKAVCASFDRGNFIAGMNQLRAFQNKVRAQVARANPVEAQAFIDCAQRILDAVACAGIARANHDQ